MIPAGYLPKTIVSRPSRIKSLEIKDIYSVSGCVSPSFADEIDFVPLPKQNGFFLFNSRDHILELAAKLSIDLSATRLFYYEVFEEEFDEKGQAWKAFGPERSMCTSIHKPERMHLEGFDVVTFQGGNVPECSPLSCNSLADKMSVNKHCLFDSFNDAKEALEGGSFVQCEAEPYRIFAIYSVEPLSF